MSRSVRNNAGKALAAHSTRARLAVRLIDGRRRRTERTHRKILAAVVNLIARVDRPLTVPEVARAAGVATRTIFVHFPDFESMWREATESVRSRFDSLVVEIPGDGSLSRRLDTWVAARAKLFERQAAFRRAGNLMLPHSMSMRQRRAQHRDYYRDRLRQTFAPELAALPARQRTRMFETLAAVADWDFWESLRIGQGLSVGAARRAWHGALEAVLAAIVALGRR